MTDDAENANGAWAGIDISKSDFHVSIFGSDTVYVFEQNRQGFEEVVELLAADTLVVMEATGGYERHLVSALQQADIATAVVNPRQVRDFARSCGKLGKTDRVDAQVLALFAERMNPAPQKRLSPEKQALKALRARHWQLMKMHVQERNRLSVASSCVADTIKEHIVWLGRQLDVVKREIQDLIASDAEMRRTAKLLQTVPGVGPTIAATLVAELPELGHASPKRVASLAGLAPFARDSGVFRGKRCIAGGRPVVRRALYMAVMVGLRFDYDIKRIYDRFKQAGKPAKVAITACMRRLLTWLNAMLRDATPWNSQFVDN